MRKIRNLIFSLFAVLFIAFSCNKKQEELSDLDKLKHSNKKSYPAVKMDSAQAINSITKQKIQELLDLSILYAAGNKDTDIDSVIYDQMNSYFLKPDSAKTIPLLKELDSFKVKNARVNTLDITKKINGKDTIDIASFEVEYFGTHQKSIGTFNKKARYILKKSPVQFVKEFKFYFVDFDFKEKENTASGVTK